MSLFRFFSPQHHLRRTSQHIPFETYRNGVLMHWSQQSLGRGYGSRHAIFVFPHGVAACLACGIRIRFFPRLHKPTAGRRPDTVLDTHPLSSGALVKLATSVDGITIRNRNIRCGRPLHDAVVLVPPKILFAATSQILMHPLVGAFGHVTGLTIVIEADEFARDPIRVKQSRRGRRGRSSAGF